MMLHLQDSLTEGPAAQRDRKLAIVALLVYVGLSLLWGLGSDAPWDDDCPTRFFYTQSAFDEPVNFVSVWNRPLFVLLFALPAQLGKEAITIGMTLVSALGAWLLWRALRHLRVPNAWLVVPMLAFQPFFFGTSRVALTEPLAAVLLCAGFFFLVRKQWRWFALMGGLLPLARLEMSVVLILWAWPLVQARAWKSLPLMALPLALWNVAGGIITGDFLYVFSQTFGADTGQNQYGNTSFGHYFHRAIWVVGPVVYGFLLQGLALRSYRKQTTLWLDGQLALGLLVYVVFSWKLSMGNAAGFLRNLVPLSPLAAVIALDGYNRVMTALAPPTADRAAHVRNDRLVMGLVAMFTAAITVFLFSVRLRQHHNLSAFPDWSRAVVVAVTAALVAVAWWGMRKAKPGSGAPASWLAMAMAGITIVYALYQEPPLASDNAERQAVGILADYYLEAKLDQFPTYANHNWFFWRIGKHPKAEPFQRVTIANLEAAPEGSVIVWDYHYSTRLAGDVGAQYLIDHLEYVELMRIGVANRGECVLVMQKAGKSLIAQELVSKHFAEQHPRFLPAIMARAYRLLALRRWDEALLQLDYALASVQNDPDLWFGKGYALLNQGKFGEAAVCLQNAVSLVSRYPIAWFNLGRALAGIGDFPGGISAFNRALAFDPLAEEAWYSRGALKGKVGDMAGAIADYGQALALNPKHVRALTDRAAAYAMIGRNEAALADIAAADKLQPGDKDILFVRGRILFSGGDKAGGCAVMQQAVAAGLDKAAAFVAKACGGDSAAVGVPDSAQVR